MQNHNETFVMELKKSFHSYGSYDEHACFSLDGYKFFPISYITAKIAACVNEYGEPNKTNLNGHHAVIRIGDHYFKSNLRVVPIDPGMEYAINSFNQLFTKQCCFKSELLLLKQIELIKINEEQIPANIDCCKFITNNVRNKIFINSSFSQLINLQKENLIVQVSNSIPGELLKDFLLRTHNDELLPAIIDISSFSYNFILALLTRPSDGKSENFIVSQTKNNKYSLISIDNDLAFSDKITVDPNSDFQQFAGIKSILFCFPSLIKLPLDAQVANRLKSVNPYIFVFKWLQTLEEKNVIYDNFEKFLSQELLKQIYLPVKLTDGSACLIIKQMFLMKDLLRINKQVTHEDLFYLLYPSLFSYYSRIIKNSTSPLDALKKIYSNERPLENGKESGARIKPGPLKGRWIFESITKEKRRRTQEIRNSLRDVLESLDSSKLSTKEYIRTVKYTYRHFYKEISSVFNPNLWEARRLCLLNLESDKFNIEFLLWKKDRTNYFSKIYLSPEFIKEENMKTTYNPLVKVHGFISDNKIFFTLKENKFPCIFSCLRNKDWYVDQLLKNREDIIVRELITSDLIDSFNKHALPKEMSSISPYSFLISQYKKALLAQNTEVISFIQNYLKNNIETYEDYVIFAIRNGNCSYHNRFGLISALSYLNDMQINIWESTQNNKRISLSQSVNKSNKVLNEVNILKIYDECVPMLIKKICKKNKTL